MAASHHRSRQPDVPRVLAVDVEHFGYRLNAVELHKTVIVFVVDAGRCKTEQQRGQARRAAIAWMAWPSPRLQRDIRKYRLDLLHPDGVREHDVW